MLPKHTKKPNEKYVHRNLAKTSLGQMAEPNIGVKNIENDLPQLAFTCSKLTIETLEQGVKYVQ